MSLRLSPPTYSIFRYVKKNLYSFKCSLNILVLYTFFHLQKHHLNSVIYTYNVKDTRLPYLFNYLLTFNLYATYFIIN